MVLVLVTGRICQLSRFLKPPVLNISCAIATVLAVSACTRGAAPVDFSDPLTGPVSPAFTIPFDKYALTPAGLERTASASGTENGIDRPIIKTVSGDYLLRDFVFEVDVRIPADHGDIVFVGLGSPRTDPTANREPTNVALFRIHNLPTVPFFGIDIAVADTNARKLEGRFREFARVANYKSGESMRFRIAHQVGNLTLSVPAISDAHRTFKTDDLRDLFGQDAFLFLANSSQGTTFRNASLRAP